MTRKIAPSLLIIALLSIFALSLGSSEISGIWRYIFNPQFDPSSLAHQIIWDIRAPRIAAALLVGASLGVAGAIAQAATNNPLAEPAILGTSAGAALGVLIGVLSNLVEVGSIGAILFATIGALAITTLVFSLAKSALTLVTIGIGVSAITSALVGLALTAVGRPDARSISFWSFGSFALVTPENLMMLAPILIAGTFLAWKIAPSLDLLSLGDSGVRHIGKSPQRIRLRAFLLLSILVAVTVSTVGAISFLALAAPHIARYLFGPSNRSLVIHSMLIGAIILLTADTFARSAFAPLELPIGLVTSLIGAPILILTIKRGGDVWR